MNGGFPKLWITCKASEDSGDHGYASNDAGGGYMPVECSGGRVILTYVTLRLGQKKSNHGAVLRL